jgi:hypothetical protein
LDRNFAVADRDLLTIAMLAENGNQSLKASEEQNVLLNVAVSSNPTGQLAPVVATLFEVFPNSFAHRSHGTFLFAPASAQRRRDGKPTPDHQQIVFATQIYVIHESALVAGGSIDLHSSIIGGRGATATSKQLGASEPDWLKCGALDRWDHHRCRHSGIKADRDKGGCWFAGISAALATIGNPTRI